MRLKRSFSKGIKKEENFSYHWKKEDLDRKKDPACEEYI